MRTLSFSMTPMSSATSMVCKLRELFIKSSLNELPFAALSLMPHKGVKQLSKRLSRLGCHPYPGLVLECVANEMILHCPTKRFRQTAQCEETRNHLKQCMQYLKYKS
uniref:IP01825p n=1 Tax=Drosophila melanogaster TaxID=7227 RepID=Q29QE6_DROME|nr:IP01825p [Drosophila melanogaster]